MADQPPGIHGPTTAPAAQVVALPTDGMAIAALVVGVIAPMAAMFDGVPGVILGSVAVFLGLSSRRRIKRSGGTLQGSGLALAGWIAGLCGIVLGLIIAVVLFSFYMAMQSGTGK